MPQQHRTLKHTCRRPLPIDDIEILVHLFLKEPEHPLPAQPVPQRVRLARAAHVLGHGLVAVVQCLADAAPEARRYVQHLIRERLQQERIEEVPLAPRLLHMTVVRQRRQRRDHRDNVTRRERVHQTQKVALHVGKLVAVQQIHGANVHDDVLVDGRQQLADVACRVADRLAGNAQATALGPSAVARQTRVQVGQRQRQEEVVANQLVLVQEGRPMVDYRRPGAGHTVASVESAVVCAGATAAAAAASTAGRTVQRGVGAAARGKRRLAEELAIHAELVIVLEEARVRRTVERLALQHGRVQRRWRLIDVRLVMLQTRRVQLMLLLLRLAVAVGVHRQHGTATAVAGRLLLFDHLRDVPRVVRMVEPQVHVALDGVDNTAQGGEVIFDDDKWFFEDIGHLTQQFLKVVWGTCAKALCDMYAIAGMFGVCIRTTDFLDGSSFLGASGQDAPENRVILGFFRFITHRLSFFVFLI